MKIHLWAHGETFKPEWRETESAWIQSYASSWAKLGASVSFGHPNEQLPPSGILHVFGSGHFETLHWLKPMVTSILFSPYPFSVRDKGVILPESIWHAKSRTFWRGLLHSSSHLTEHSCLAIPELFVCPRWAEPLIAQWEVQNTILLVGDNAEDTVSQLKAFYEKLS